MGKNEIRACIKNATGGMSLRPEEEKGQACLWEVKKSGGVKGLLKGLVGEGL